MRRPLSKTFRFFLTLVLIAGWLFSGWPPIWQNGRIVTETRVAFAGTAGPTNCGTAADDSTVGTVTWTNVTNACTASQSTSAANLTSAVLSHYIKATNFGFSIPTGSAINGITVTVSKSGTQGNGTRVVVDNSIDIIKGGTIQTTQDKADTTTAWPTTKSAVSYGGIADLWLLTWTAADINSSGFGVAISAKGRSTTAETATVYAFVTITVTYNAPPNAPSQDSPADAATGVSTTPTFLMTATDPESNSIGYKVTIYSDSLCTTVVQTNDQAVSATGWTGSNATCTASPTSCYTSGTQGSFLTQTALSNSTQYWWKASAKDPDGSGTFTDSSTCHTFTTSSAAATLTLTVVSGGVTAFGTLTSGTRKTGTTQLQVTQTGATSLTISVGRQLSVSNATLASNAAPLTVANQISDTAGGIDVFSTIANCATAGSQPAVWASGASTGLGFTNYAATSGKSTSCWGSGATETDSLNQYAALQASASAASFISVSSPPATFYASVGYSLDVASTQKATVYNGGVVFSATVSP